MFDPAFSPMSEIARKHSFCANPWTDDAGIRHAILKVQAVDYEFNISLTENEVIQIQLNDPGKWALRESMRLGKCIESAVYWCLEGEDLAILIGHDDESWSVAFQLPLSSLLEIRRALSELAPWLSGRSLPRGYYGHDPDDYAHIYDKA
jgi:hypothetical protein